MSEGNRNQQDFLPIIVIGSLAAVIVCVAMLGVVLIGGVALFGVSSTTVSVPPQVTVEVLPGSEGNAGPAIATQVGSNDELPPTLNPDLPTPVPPSAGDMADTLAALDAVIVPPRDRAELARRLLGVEEVSLAPPQDWGVGERDSFFVSDDFGTSTVEAELVYISGQVYAWVESGVNYDANALEREIDRFALEIVPVVLQTFGGENYPPPGQDVQFHILHNTAMSPTVAGYYSSSSEWPLEAVEFSNERSMFMINITNTTPGSFGYIDVLTHEFQHLIHWHTDLNEETWINEGMSEVAPYLVGLGASNFTDSYLRNPTVQITDWPETESTLPHYGGGYLFAVYFLEQFGAEGVQALVANPLNGMEAVQDTLSQLGYDISADQVFADFVVANYLNDSSVAPEYGYGAIEAEYGSLNLSTPSLTGAFDAADYPLTQTEQFVKQYGANYIQLEADSPLLIEFDGSDSLAVLPTSTLDTDSDPQTDDRIVWWSNRGDESNMTLTRAFDLTEVSEAVLEYDLWFLIEDRWDYGYIEVSVDDGETWEILPTPYTTTDNPYGNAYGPGYTGSSADFAEADPFGWVPEAIDLGPYTGQEILVRFEMVTDDAVNRPGFAVDNLRIDALGYYDDAESGDGGWEARGFVRHDNTMPQGFIVQVMLGDGTVERMTLDEFNSGVLEIPAAREPAVLVISGVGRHTTVSATYDLTITTVE